MLDDCSIDFNSDGVFDYEMDILFIFLWDYLVIYGSLWVSEVGGFFYESGSYLFNV